MSAGAKALVSIGSGPQQRLLALARRTFAPYARLHGYDLVLRTDRVQHERPAPWDKVRLLRGLLPNYELLLWLDADLMILDRRRDIADDLPGDRMLGLVEHAFEATRMPNSGVMLLRAGEEAAAFLDAVWAQERFVDHAWWENAAICHLLGYALDPPRPVRSPPLLERTAFLDPRWNSIPDAPARAPRIRHYPGYALRTRRALMLRDLALAPLRGRRSPPPGAG